MGPHDVRFGYIDIGVDVEGFLPVAAGLVALAVDVVGVGEAGVGASLLHKIAGLDGQGQGGGVLVAGLVGASDGVRRLAEAVEAFQFAGTVADPAEECDCLQRRTACWR